MNYNSLLPATAPRIARLFVALLCVVSWGTAFAAITATPAVPVFQFPALAVGSSSTIMTVNVVVSGYTGTFTPTMSLHYNLDYTLQSVSCSGAGPETCVVSLIFHPTLPGARKDALFVMNGTTRLATVLLSGVGNSPLGVLQPGVFENTASIAALGTGHYSAPAADENHTVYFFYNNNLYSSRYLNSPVLVLANATSGDVDSLAIDGAGVLYWGQGPALGTASHIQTYDTVQGVAGTFPMPATDAFPIVAVDGLGDVFAVGTNTASIYKVLPNGTSTTTAINPAIVTPGDAATDAAGDFFVGGNTINELTAGGTQSQVSTTNANKGLATDAGGTLYGVGQSGNTFELAPQNYATTAYAYSTLQGVPTYGLVSASDGTFYAGMAGTIDIVDRTQSPLAFNNQVTGVASATQTVSVLNAGNQPLAYSNIAISGTGFALQTAATSPCGAAITLAAGASCNLAVNFTAPHAGSFTGSVVLTSNSLNLTGTTQTVALTAFAPGTYITTSPTTISFPGQAIGTTSGNFTVTVMNTGYSNTTGPVTIISSNPAFIVNTAGSNLGYFPCTGALAANGPYNCQFFVTFNPALVQNYTGTITVTGAGGTVPSSSAVIAVSGSGTPTVTQTGGGASSSLIFNNAAVGIAAGSAQTLTASFTLTGYTAAPTSATAAMHYGTSYTSGTLSCSGGSPTLTCTVPVTFVPKYPGGRRDAVMVTINGALAAAIQVYGVGTAPMALVQPGVITYPILNNAGYYYNSVVGEDGTEYVTGSNSSSAYSVTKTGVVTQLPITFFGNSPQYVAIDGAGTLYFTTGDYGTNIVTYTAAGQQGSKTLTLPTGYTPCSTATGLYGINAGIAGDLYVFDNECQVVYEQKRDGTAAATVLNPAITQATGVAVDSSENVFVGGYAINEITAGGTQTQVTTNGNSGIAVDAADTVYVSRDSDNATYSYAIGMLPASNYAHPIAALDGGGGPTGGPGIAPDGTVYVGDYSSVDRVDRSQGLFTFNSVNALQVATPQTATIYNGGNLPLTLTSMTLTGDPDYMLSNNGCTSGLVIQPGAICSVTVNFTSPRNGIFTGSLTFVTNSLNTTTTQTVALTDTVTGAYLTATPTTLNFGTVPLNTPSAAQTILVTNSGGSVGTIVASDNNGRYAITTPAACTNLAINASCTLSVVFTPTVAGAAVNTTGNISATSTGNYSNNIALTFTGTGGPAAAPIATLSATSLTFLAPIGTTSPTQVVQLSNTGNAPLFLTNLYATGSSFFAIVPTLTTNPCTGTTTLAAGASCNIAVNFTTVYYASAGPYAGVVTINDNAAGQPQTISLTGNFTSTPQLQFTPTQLTAIAGTGTVTSSGTGDGGSALSATFTQPFAVAEDPSGNTYVVDYGANYVRKIAPNGTITQFAGQVGYSNHGFSGDGGPAINAQFYGPDGIAVDAAGNVYIADEYNGRVRVVNALTGIISTYAGTGVGSYTPGATALNTRLPGPVGLTFDPSGNLYIAMGGNASIVVQVAPSGATSLYAGVMSGSSSVPGYNGDNILATAAELSNPLSVASDQSGNLYIADNGNSRVRKVTAATGKITTIAGTGVDSSTGDGGAAVNATVNPYNVAVDLAGEVYIEGANGALNSFSVRKINANTVISTVAGGGTGGLGGAATSANFNYVLEGIAIDNNGSLLITTNGPAQILSAGPAGFYQFPSTTVGTTSASQVITFENTGNANLVLTNSTYTATGPFAVLPGTSCFGGVTLGTGYTCVIGVTFTPTAATAQSGTITVPSNGSIPSQTIYLQGTGTPAGGPQAALAPALTFAPSAVNTTTAAQMVTLTNAGTAALSITSASTGSTQFVLSANTCGSSLAMNSSCTYSITFTPSAAGAQSATLTVVDAVGTQTAGLSGTGTAPQAALASPLTFAATTVNTTTAAQMVTLTNAGNAALPITSATSSNPEFVVSANTCGSSLAMNSSCTYSITFTPSATGAQTGMLSVVDSVGTQTVALSGTGNAAPTPQAMIGAGLTFGSTPVGSAAATQTISLSNPSTVALTITSVVASGAGFSQTNTCNTSVAAGGSCLITVTFTPGSAGTLTGAVTVTDNASPTTQTATLSGTGTAPQAALTSTLTFPSTVINTTSASMTATLTNAGNAALAISSTAFSGTQFSLIANTCNASLAANSSCNYTFTFTPSATGTQTTPFTVNDSVGVQVLTLSGVGSAAAAPLAALTATLAFPSTVINTTATAMTATLTNAGTAALPITSATLAGSQFALTGNTCGSSLALGASCAYTITFTPTATGAQTATLTVVDSVGTQTTAITGTGSPVPVAQAVLSPTSLTFASTFMGTSAAVQTIALSNPGAATLTGIAIAFTGASPVNAYTETSTCGTTLAAGANCVISVTFTPPAANTYTASLSVTDSVGTQTAALTGSGNSSTGFTVVAPSPTQTVDPGGVAIFNVNVNTLTGNFTLPVTMSASGLPPGATYSFAPASVTPGTTGATTVLTIQTSQSVAGVEPFGNPLRLPLFAALLLLPLAGLGKVRRRFRSLSPALRLLTLLLLSLATILPLSGCGGGGYFGQGPQTFIITVTGTSAVSTQSTTVTLNLQ